ncbi:MAG: hypothetical protein QM765_04465 [Myxococcales bacterium]
MSFQNLLAAEGHQPPDQIAGPLGGVQDLRGLLLRLTGRQVLGQHPRVAEDRKEQVVQVVGRAPGELAHHLHLLGLAELLLEHPALLVRTPALGHVQQRALHRRPALVGDARAQDLHVDLRAVLAQAAELVVAGRLRGGLARGDLGGDLLDLGGGDQPAEVDAHQLARPRPAEDAREALVAEGEAAILDDVGADQRVLHQRPVLALRLRQRHLGPLAVGDVHVEADDAGGAAGRVQGHALVEDDVAEAAVRVGDLRLVDLRATLLQQRTVGAVVDRRELRFRRIEDRVPDDSALASGRRSARRPGCRRCRGAACPWRRTGTAACRGWRPDPPGRRPSPPIRAR